MMYQGGKYKLAKHIVPILQQAMADADTEIFIEPFVGACNIAPHLIAKHKFASDINADLIAMYLALQRGWEPPQSVSAEEYYYYSKHRQCMPPALRAYVSIACSFAGKYWGGYARDRKTGKDMSRQAYRSVVSLGKTIHDIVFTSQDYTSIHPVGAVIYADPPYKGTLGYLKMKFDHDLFWTTVKEWSKRNVVFVSEFSAPEDVELVARFERRSSMTLPSQGRPMVTDCLYRVGSL